MVVEVEVLVAMVVLVLVLVAMVASVVVLVVLVVVVMVMVIVLVVALVVVAVLVVRSAPSLSYLSHPRGIPAANIVIPTAQVVPLTATLKLLAFFRGKMRMR